jgi:hypothetical protein
MCFVQLRGHNLINFTITKGSGFTAPPFVEPGMGLGSLENGRGVISGPVAPPCDRNIQNSMPQDQEAPVLVATPDINSECLTALARFVLLCEHATDMFAFALSAAWTEEISWSQRHLPTANSMPWVFVPARPLGPSSDTFASGQPKGPEAIVTTQSQQTREARRARRLHRSLVFQAPQPTSTSLREDITEGSPRASPA